MKVMQFCVGAVSTNCYVIYDEAIMHGAIIDPGDNAKELMDYIAKQKVTLDYILLTHGHFDHILAVDEIAKKIGAKVVMHRGDEYLLTPDNMRMFGMPLRSAVPTVDIWAEEGTEITIGALTIRYLHTPGPTPGSCTLMCGSLLFTGDTMFRHECGRCDLPGGDFDTILKALRRLHDLEGDDQVLPGHEGLSTLADERVNNPYVRQALRQ